MSRRPIFVAATRQHVGKTTVSLALLAGLKKRFARVGFMKPVGQQHIPVEGGAVRVDKDVQLMKEYFDLGHLQYSDMSPVLVPSSYTKRFIDGHISQATQVEAIERSFGRVDGASELTLLEGTGHVGVGSVIDMSNAAVAAHLGADCILVANGGIGKAFDELELNRVSLQEKGVRIRGIILNKVMPDKVDMVRDYFGRAAMARWGVPLLGVVPDLPFLGKATLSDLEKLLDGELIAGERYRAHHYGIDDVQTVTTGVRRYLRKQVYRQEMLGEKRPLLVTHCTRDDILLGYLAYFHRKKQEYIDAVETRTLGRDASTGERTWLGAIVLCKGSDEGCESTDENMALPYLKEIAQAYDAPVMLAQPGTTEATDKITQFTAKMHIGDKQRVAAAIGHYEKHIDFDQLLQ